METSTLDFPPFSSPQTQTLKVLCWLLVLEVYMDWNEVEDLGFEEFFTRFEQNRRICCIYSSW